MAYLLEAYPALVTWSWILSKLSPHTLVRATMASFLTWLCWTHIWATQNLHQGRLPAQLSAKSRSVSSQLWAITSFRASLSFTVSLPWVQTLPRVASYGDWIRQVCKGWYISLNIENWRVYIIAPELSTQLAEAL